MKLHHPTTPYIHRKHIKKVKDLNPVDVLINKQVAFFFVLEGGLEPPQPQWPRDFKSLVSTDSTIRACNRERKTGLEPATLTLARLCSTN